MAGEDNRQKITVETLLRLKRNERPQGEFWNAFEQDFERRRLNALVERRAWRDWLVLSPVKAVAFAIPAIALLGLLGIGSRMEVLPPSRTVSAPANQQTEAPEPLVLASQPKPVKQAATIDMDTRLASSQFVLDALQDNSGNSGNFRKVLYTPAIRLSAPTGAFYVRDSLSSSNYKVTTADAKLGRNF